MLVSHQWSGIWLRGWTMALTSFSTFFFLFKEYSWFSFYFYCILNFIIHLVCVCLWECMNGDAYHDILVVKGQLARVYSLRWQYGSWWGGGTQITSLGGTGLPLPTAPSRRPGFSIFGNRCFYILCSFFFLTPHSQSSTSDFFLMYFILFILCINLFLCFQGKGLTM